MQTKRNSVLKFIAEQDLTNHYVKAFADKNPTQRSVRPSAFLNMIDLMPLITQTKPNQDDQAIRRRKTIKRAEENQSLPQLSSSSLVTLQSNPAGIMKAKKQSLTENKMLPDLVENKLKPRQVGFRRSIQIVDFTNDIISKDVIDGERKPLIRKTHRKFKTMQDVESYDQII
ncbi:hypothetical protein pb186bvf_005157 [Paramecium bursaria]